MELNTKASKIIDTLSAEIINYIAANEADLGLTVSNAYYKFPILRDEEDSLSIAELLIVSKKHGVIILSSFTGDDKSRGNLLSESLDKIDQTSALVFSRLLRNKNLRERRNNLKFDIHSLLYAPLLSESSDDEMTRIARTSSLGPFLISIEDEMGEDLYNDLISTIEGARGIVRPKQREITDIQTMKLGYLANEIEAEIYKFDKLQKYGAMSVLDGFQRIRGLAGSGKTVILAMKAALTHLRNPNEKIAYCFYTKSLYQHIKRLITRFYRQFDDKDPNWENLHVIHAWGGSYDKGLYSSICAKVGVPMMSFAEASRASDNAFGYACRTLLESQIELPQMYDCIFIDEGQDFPPEFISLCIEVSKDEKVIYAYDELQTIFQPSAPTIESIRRGEILEISDDVVLKKCYRNPLEIIVCAHALGFGIYSEIIQMLENAEQWKDVGYDVIEGDFIKGSRTIIRRPSENSLGTLSSSESIDDIIRAEKFSNTDEEADFVSRQIAIDISSGLRPDDILVIAIDDRNAKKYLRLIESRLIANGIGVNNIHGAGYGIKDFQEDSCVTLSTVHKAKGNESFMVYVVGMDALYTPLPSPKERNMIFTALTRAKGWIRVTGMTNRMDAFIAELNAAKSNCPNLIFNYPDITKIRTILRDLEDPEFKKAEMENTIASLLKEFNADDILSAVSRKSRKK